VFPYLPIPPDPDVKIPGGCGSMSYSNPIAFQFFDEFFRRGFLTGIFAYPGNQDWLNSTFRFKLTYADLS
jgi:hypothetical protein